MSIIAVIPALDKNNYSQFGDLNKWGDTTLLEWKISQLSLVEKIDKIVISTDSDKIKNVATKIGIEVFDRGKSMDLHNAIIHSCSKIDVNDHVLWTNPTFPFMDQHIFSAFIMKYYEQDKPKDGLVTSRLVKEYLYNNNGPLNFDNNDPQLPRQKLKDIFMLTNAAYISRCEFIRERGKIVGQNPMFFNTSWLSSLEISKSEDIDMFSELISKYITEQL